MTNALRDLNLETDVTAIVWQCPWTAEEVRPEWFIDRFQAEVICYLQEHQPREGLTLHLAKMFSMGSKEVLEKLEAWRKAAQEYRPVILMPKYAARLKDLFERRQKLTQANVLAIEAFEGIPVDG